MLPILAHVGHFPIYSYGAFTAAGFLLAILWSIYLAGKEGIPAVKMEGLALVIVVTAGVGSKLLTAYDYPGFYSGGSSHFLFDQVLGRGGVFYGGFLFAVASSAVYCRVAGLPGWQIADCVAPGLALAQGLGRIGCFLAGCCWGTATQLPSGVVFTSEVAHDITGVPLYLKLHPTQLYEASLALLVIPLLVWLTKTKAFQGEVMLVYVLYYAVARFFLEFFRGDPRGYYLDGLLSTSQIISVFLILFAPLLLRHLAKNNLVRRGTAERGSGNSIALS